jgi:hypothetical protein
MTAGGVGQHGECSLVRQTQPETGKVRLVGVVYRADALTSTLVLCQRCATWAWRTKPPRRLSGELLARAAFRPDAG